MSAGRIAMVVSAAINLVTVAAVAAYKPEKPRPMPAMPADADDAVAAAAVAVDAAKPPEDIVAIVLLDPVETAAFVPPAAPRIAESSRAAASSRDFLQHATSPTPSTTASAADIAAESPRASESPPAAESSRDFLQHATSSTQSTTASAADIAALASGFSFSSSSSHGRGTELPSTIEGVAPAGEFVTSFLGHSKPLEVTPDTGRIIANGRQLYIPDIQVPATINDDGTVTFHDKGDFEIHFALHIPTGKEIGDTIADWYKDPYAQTHARAVQEMAPHEQAVDPTVVGGSGGWDAGAGGDGMPDGETKKPGHGAGGPMIPIIEGGFDITAWAMRKLGVGDPYASRKREVLAATFSERVEVGARHTQRQYARTGEITLKNLARARAITDAKARHEALFEMWDECAEGEGRQAEAGDRARAMIVGHIRGHETFTPDEIAAFDAHRSSRKHFAPYSDTNAE